MTAFRTDPLTPQDAVDLAPLRYSHEASDLESELKALFLLLFETYVRPGERIVNTSGIPHLGAFTQVERAVKAEGLALKRRGSDAALRYLFRAWRARNPKRGLHMLRIYLQLLWPNAWNMHQMWFNPAGTYALDASLANTQVTPSYVLTSRVHVQIEAGATDGSDVLAVAPAMRSTLPARILLKVTVISNVYDDLAAASGYAGSYIQYFTGDLQRPDDQWGPAPGLYQGAAINYFSGDFQ